MCVLLQHFFCCYFSVVPRVVSSCLTLQLRFIFLKWLNWHLLIYRQVGSKHCFNMTSIYVFICKYGNEAIKQMHTNLDMFLFLFLSMPFTDTIIIICRLFIMLINHIANKFQCRTTNTSCQYIRKCNVVQCYTNLPLELLFLFLLVFVSFYSFAVLSVSTKPLNQIRWCRICKCVPCK